MNRFRRKALSFVLVFALFAGIVGAVSVDTSYAATKKIHLKKTAVTVYTGTTYQQKLIDKNGKTIKATTVKWKSSNTAVAKINKKGKITAVKKGTATISAKYKGKTYKCKVTVKKSKLSYNGIYVFTAKNSSSGDKLSYCLRFYDDGTAISVSVKQPDSGEPAYPKNSWFNKDNRINGTYTFKNGKIIVRIPIDNPIDNPDKKLCVEYKGSFSGKDLVLDSVSEMTGFKQKGAVYKYIPFKDIPNWE